MVLCGLAAILVMGLVQGLMGRVLGESPDRLGTILIVGLVTLFGLVTYLASALLLRIQEVRDAINVVRRRLARSR